jgi:chromosome partitioning protein
MILTIANTKGGTGKSTVAFSITTFLSGKFENVLLIDTDVQLSTANAYSTRLEKNENQNITCISIQTPTIHREASKFNNLYDITIVDTGGRDSKTFRSACSAADVIIIPMKPTQLDLEATEETLQLLDEIRSIKEIQVFMLLNQAIIGSNLSSEILQIMIQLEEDYKVNTFNTILHNRVDFARSIEYGLSALEFNPKGKAAKELNELFLEIDKKILNNNFSSVANQK